MLRKPCHPDRALFWVGVAACILTAGALVVSRGTTWQIWRTTHTYALVGYGYLQFAVFHAGTVAVGTNGVPTNFVNQPPIWTAAIPLWFLLGATSTLTALCWAWGRRTPAARCPACGHLSHCPGCGYALSGLPSGTKGCPECGASLAGQGRRRRIRVHALIRWALVAACTLLLAGLVASWSTSRRIWVTEHTSCVFKYGLAEVAVFRSNAIQLDARGLPQAFLGKPIWVSQVPLWAVLVFAAVLTVIAWMWDSRRWLEACAKCGRQEA